MQLLLVATLNADRLVLRLMDGTPHSDFPVLDSDPTVTLAADGHGPLVRVFRPWSLIQLDVALGRHGYIRTTPWGDGPSAEITRPV